MLAVAANDISILRGFVHTNTTITITQLQFTQADNNIINIIMEMEMTPKKVSKKKVSIYIYTIYYILYPLRRLVGRTNN